MAKLTERRLIENVGPVAPEHLVGDLIQSWHPLFGLVWINSERVSGTPCFYGTRVPIKTLFDSLAAGQTLESNWHTRIFSMLCRKVNKSGHRSTS